MNRRLTGGAQSLSAQDRTDGIGGDEWPDRLVCTSAAAAVRLGGAEELNRRQKLLSNAMDGLNAREREIIVARRLNEVPSTLEDLSQKLGISRERVRQIEVRAFEKLQQNMKIAAEREGLLPAS